MNTLYQSLVAVEPVTLIVTICNLFLQLYVVKRFFLRKILAVLDARRETADRQIAEAQNAKEKATAIKETYEANLRQAREQANQILIHAQTSAAARSDALIGQAQAEIAHLKAKAATDIAREKQKALNAAKDEISGIAVAIAEKVVERQLKEVDQETLVNRFIDQLEDSL